MNIRHILKAFTLEELMGIAIKVHVFFNLVSSKRIYRLFLQVDSIDIALYLLMCHKESKRTLDAIVYDWLLYKDDEQ